MTYADEFRNQFSAFNEYTLTDLLVANEEIIDCNCSSPSEIVIDFIDGSTFRYFI